jgi:uncharacterized protein
LPRVKRLAKREFLSEKSTASRRFDRKRIIFSFAPQLFPMDKPTLVIGASPNRSRFSYRAVQELANFHYPVFAVGIREGEIDGIQIQKPFPELPEIHTVTLYIGAQNQPDYYDFILGLKPQRVIFNPGTENEKFEEQLAKKGIEVVQGCTLVMLYNGLF